MDKTMLEGGCYVATPAGLDFTHRDNWEEAPVIDRAMGADKISQYLVRVHPGRSPIRSYPGADGVLYVVRGQGKLTISGRDFDIAPEMGAYVKPGEAFSVDNPGDEALELVVSVCPECEEPRWLEEMPDNFDDSNPVRTVALDQTKKEATADRYFQLLVGKEMGSTQVTQFIGSVPQSKAPPHHHHYEEAITVLAGEGFMWAGEARTALGPGCMIYLPREQTHCVECTAPAGIQLLGMFYPAGSPTVRYDD